MASQNVLLSRSSLRNEEQFKGNPIPEATNKKTPVWRYHKDCPQGKVFKRDDDLAKAEAEGGWVDHPGKITRLVGHEKTFDLYNETGGRGDNTVEILEIKFREPEVINPEDAIRAKELKEASDLIEKNRLEAEEKAKNPPKPEVFECEHPGCGKKFLKAKALRMHTMAAHKIKKDIALDEIKISGENKV